MHGAQWMHFTAWTQAAYAFPSEPSGPPAAGSDSKVPGRSQVPGLDWLWMPLDSAAQRRACGRSIFLAHWGNSELHKLKIQGMIYLFCMGNWWYFHCLAVATKPVQLIESTQTVSAAWICSNNLKTLFWMIDKSLPSYSVPAALAFQTALI